MHKQYRMSNYSISKYPLLHEFSDRLFGLFSLLSIDSFAIINADLTICLKMLIHGNENSKIVYSASTRLPH